MATKIEIILNGVGSITIEHDDEVWTKRAIKNYAAEALVELTKLAPAHREPIGFASGSDSGLERNHRQDPDPYDFGEVIR